MKIPDLSVAADAGVREWSGAPEAVKAAAGAAKLKFCSLDLHGVGGKNELMAALDKALKLPEHFGNNWDALADCLEDDDWLGAHGIAIFVRHADVVGRRLQAVMGHQRLVARRPLLAILFAVRLAHRSG